MHKIFQAAAISGLAMTAVSGAAFAEMGLAPRQGSGLYGSVEGGFGLQSTSDSTTYGVSGNGIDFSDARIGGGRGWFIGGTVGWAVDGTIVGPVNRIEGYVTYLSNSDNASDGAPPLNSLGIVSADGAVQFVGGTEAVAKIDRRTIEGGARLISDHVFADGGSHTWALTPFIRHMSEEIDVTVVGCCTANLHSEVDNTLYGVMVTFEPEWRLSNRLSVVARLGAGLYGYHSSGHFRSSSAGIVVPDPLAANVSDDRDGVGFRGQLGLGIKYWVLPHANIEPFAEADYLSRVGRAALANFGQPDAASRIATDDLWELRTGIRINIGLQ